MSNKDNPFAALSGMFPDAQKKASVSVPVKGRVKQGMKGKEQPAPLDEDAELFFDAMQSIKPLKEKKDHSGGRDLGGVLKEAMQMASFEAEFSTPGQRKANDPVKSAPLSSVAERKAAENKQNTPVRTRAAALKAELETAFNISEERQITPAQDEENLFSKAMSGVAPISAKGREVDGAKAAVKPTPAVDPAKALRESLEGQVEFSLFHSDEYFEGHVLGIDQAIFEKLKAGAYSPEAHLDLHGLNAKQAYDSLLWFIKSSYQRSLRNVIIVTGRGKNSPNGFGVLRPLLQEWLTRDPFKRVVLAFCTAKPADGGPGAVYLLLRKYKKSRGKIVWEKYGPDLDNIEL